MNYFKWFNAILTAAFIVSMAIDLYAMINVALVAHGDKSNITVSGEVVYSACLAMVLVIGYAAHELYEYFFASEGCDDDSDVNIEIKTTPGIEVNKIEFDGKVDGR